MKHMSLKLCAGLLVAGILILGGCGTPPRVPDKPSGPLKVPTGGTATYKTKTTDPNNLPVYYQFDWGDNNQSAYTGPFSGDSEISDTHSFLRSGTFDVRARAKNSKATSNWSDTLMVAVQGGDSAMKWHYQFTDPGDQEAILPFKGSVSASRDGATLVAASDPGSADVSYGYVHLLDVVGNRKGTPFHVSQDEDVVSSQSFTSDGKIIVSSDVGLYAGLLNGSQAWEVLIVADGGLAACDKNGNVFVNCEDGMLHALKSDHTDLWTPVRTGGGQASPAISADGSLVIIGGDDSLVQAFNTASGSQVWAVPTQGAIECSPAIASDGKIIIGSDDGILRAIKPDGGGPVWTYAANSPITASPVIDQNGVIYFVSDNGILHAVNSDGSPKNTMNLGCSDPSSGAITISGILYLTASFGGDDSLIAVNTSTWTRRWGVAVPDLTGGGLENTPMIQPDGTVIVTSADADVGGVYAFWGKDGPAASSWPVFQHDASRTGQASQ